MTAKRLDIIIEQGADFSKEFDLPQGIELAGAMAAMQIRSEYGYPSALLTLTTENGRLAINATTRKLTASFDAATASAFLAGSYVYDNKIRESGGRTTRLYQGAAVVTPEVTLFDFDDAFAPALLLETGGYLLLENGSRLLLETGTYAPPAVLMENGGNVLAEDGGRILMES